MLVVLALVIIVCFLIAQKRPQNSPPGPIRLPILGNTHLMIDARKTLPKIGEKFGGLFSLQLGNQFTIFIADHDIAVEAYQRQGPTFAGRPALGAFFADQNAGGTEIAFGDYSSRWRNLKKFVHSSLLTKAKITLFHEKIGAEVCNLLSEFQTAAFQSVCISPTDAIRRCSTNVIFGLMFGEAFEKDDPKFKTLNDSLKFLGSVLSPNIRDFFPWLRYFSPQTELRKENIKHRDIRDDFFRTHIERHQKALKSGKPIEDFCTDFLRSDLFSSADARSSFMVLVGIWLAAMDTTATASEWALLLLANRPAVQDKMRQEIFEKLGTTKFIEGQHLPLLSYCSAVLMEVLRLCPAATFGLPHKTTTNTHLCGFSIPKDTTVFVDVLGIHMNDKFYPNASMMLPERWLDTLNPAKPLFTFGMGPRECPGKGMGIDEALLIITNVVNRFTLSPSIGEKLPEVGIQGIVYNPIPFKLSLKINK